MAAPLADHGAQIKDQGHDAVLAPKLAPVFAPVLAITPALGHAAS
jgi:hypothetical protein